MSDRIQITDASLETIAGPGFTVDTEDGPATRWHYSIGLVLEDGRRLYLHTDIQFASSASRLLERIESFGSIDPAKWDDKDPWHAYHDGETLEQRLQPFGSQWQQEREDDGFYR